MKHKHCEVIKAWADGAKVQVKNWRSDWADYASPDFNPLDEYRIKPKEYPKSNLTDVQLVSKYFNGGNVSRTQEYEAWRRIADEAIKHFIESDEAMNYFINPENGFIVECN